MNHKHIDRRQFMLRQKCGYKMLHISNTRTVDRKKNQVKRTSHHLKIKTFLTYSCYDECLRNSNNYNLKLWITRTLNTRQLYQKIPIMEPIHYLTKSINWFAEIDAWKNEMWWRSQLKQRKNWLCCKSCLLK